MLVLFDIDGTLLHSLSAGVHAITSTLRELHGIEPDFKQIEIHGRLDTLIWRDLSRIHGYPTDDASRPWKASVRSEDWVLAIDAARSLLVLSIAGREIGDVTVWPREWTLPGQEPGPLEAALMIARLG
jgi:beta-phosphoglucomutase-like phosphatase (HAD superfamily)